MSDFNNDRGILVFLDRRTRAEAAVIALMAAREFAQAQRAIPDLRAYSNYEDWRETREGFQMGLAMAGVDAKVVNVVLNRFLAWCRLRELAPSERTLDAFASTVSMFRSSPEPSVLATIGRREFDAYRQNIPMLLAHTDYRQWLRHRQATRIKAAAASVYLEELPIILDDFIKWSACVARLSEPSVDHYAQLLLEYFADDAAELES
jgi:hypothetical protein